MNRDQLISFCFIVLLVFIVYLMFRIFSPFFNAIFWSAILAFTFYPLYLKLKAVLPRYEILPAILMTVIVFLVVIPPLVVILVNITAQTIELYQVTAQYISEGGLERLLENLRSLGFIQQIEAKLIEWEPLKENAKEWFLNSIKMTGNFAASQVATITKNLFIVSLNLLFMSFLIFIFFKDGRTIYEFIYQITPMQEKNKKPVFFQINETFAAVIRGQLLTSLVQAFVAGVIFSFLALPVPLFFAVVTFITTLIPFLGAAAVWLPMTIYLIFMQSYVKAMILFLLGVFVISLIDNIIKPALIGERAKLSYFLLFFGILGGLKIFGIMGLFLAPVILSLFFALVKIYLEEYSTA